MRSVGTRVIIYLLIMLSLFIWLGKEISDLSGMGNEQGGETVEVTPEGGESIFWGKGRCHTCHSLGERGSAVRGPNLGVLADKFDEPIGLRAISRARERSAKKGVPYTATDYLMESLAEPGAYLVEGYRNEMAVLYAPPVSLGIDEIKAIIAYLQVQGGEPDLDAIMNPTEITEKYYRIIASASTAGGGDPLHGGEIFQEVCALCHSLDNNVDAFGPDLSAIGDRGVKYISASILTPARIIAAGYETYLVTDKMGRIHAGLKEKGPPASVRVMAQNGTIATLSPEEIVHIAADEHRSVMPEDYADVLSVRDFNDLLSFLLMQKRGG